MDDSVVGRLSHCVQTACFGLAHPRFGEATAPAARPCRHRHSVTALANLPHARHCTHCLLPWRAVRVYVKVELLHSSATQQAAARVRGLRPAGCERCVRGFAMAVAASVLAEGGRHRLMSSTEHSHQKSSPAPRPLQRLACAELRRATDAPFQFPLQIQSLVVGTASPALRSRNSYQWRLCTFELAQLGPAVVCQTVSTSNTHLTALLCSAHVLSCLVLSCLVWSSFLRCPAVQVPAAPPTGSAQTRHEPPQPPPPRPPPPAAPTRPTRPTATAVQ